MYSELQTGSTLLSSAIRKQTRQTVPIMLWQGMPLLIIKTKNFPTTFKDGDIKDINAECIAILEDLARTVQQQGIDLQSYEHSYLNRLRDTGRMAYNHVLPEDTRTYLNELECEGQQQGLSMTFTTVPGMTLFWEMLYMGKPFGLVDPTQFWGFRYPLGRTYWEIKASDQIDLQHGVFAAIHGQLSASHQEIASLTTHMGTLCDQLSINLIVRMLEEILSTNIITDEDLINAFHGNDFCYGLVHFACHCSDTVGAGASQSYLSLTAHEANLDIYLERLIAYEEYGFVNKPFVFLNACGSATPEHLLQSINLPAGMLKFGARGVIATACTIPDNFASAFASEFYQRLIQKLMADRTANIGETLLETRWHFLTRYNNPLGLAYGLHAVSNQELVLNNTPAL